MAASNPLLFFTLFCLALVAIGFVSGYFVRGLVVKRVVKPKPKPKITPRKEVTANGDGS